MVGIQRMSAASQARPLGVGARWPSAVSSSSPARSSALIGHPPPTAAESPAPTIRRTVSRVILGWAAARRKTDRSRCPIGGGGAGRVRPGLYVRNRRTRVTVMAVGGLAVPSNGGGSAL